MTAVTPVPDTLKAGLPCRYRLVVYPPQKSLATSIGGRDPLPSPQLEQRGVKGDSQIVLCALMLSACAPMTAAVRLPPQSNAADRKSAAYSRALNAPLRPCPSRLVGLTPTREQRNCAALNAVCVKDRGDATCVCNVGFAMTPTGCVDTCVLKACGVNGKCVKDSAGAASCVCDTGFALQADGKTCTGTSFY
ncbi:unnamed protein product, partial [Closterium sp. NIES-65]